MGLKVVLDSPPDLILSGVNAGANLGDDITYSGTVSAAMEGALAGIRSIALSQVMGPEAPRSGDRFAIAGYLGNQRLALATRVGGRAVWGAYQWFESASISGDNHDVRGYYNGRYRGDSSLYGNAELRWWIGKRKG